MGGKGHFFFYDTKHMIYGSWVLKLLLKQRLAQEDKYLFL